MSGGPSPAEETLGASTVAMLLLFGSVILATVAMAARTWLLEDFRAITHAVHLTRRVQASQVHGHRPAVHPLETNFISIFAFAYHASLFGLLLLAIYLLERHPPFPHGDRTAFDADFMVFAIALVFVAACFTLERNDGGPAALIDGGKSVSFRGDTTVATGASRASHRSVGTGGRRSSEASGSFRESASSGETIFLQEEKDFDTGSRASIRSEEHKSMLTGLYEGANSSQSVGGQSLATSAAKSLASAATAHSVDMKLDEILMDTDTSKTDRSYRKENGIFGGSRGTVSVEPMNDVLNYSQSLEWKGWMSAAFLAYEMANATQNMSSADVDGERSLNGQSDIAAGDINIYRNLGRLFITSFIFMTGFNHTTYFYAKQDYSIVRVLWILFRINLGVAFLCLTLGNRYILYQICPLHSYSFLLVYGALAIRQDWNYSKFGTRKKILSLAATVFLIWDCHLGLFRLLHAPFFSSVPVGLLEAPNGPMFEWYYHSHLHHWAALMGMCFAVNHPITSLMLRKLEALGGIAESIAKGLTAVALMSALWFWIKGPLNAPKYSFDASHPYFGFLPVLCYLYLRNINLTMREHALGLFKSIGRYSLEIYLLHHHLLLSNDGSSVLVLIPGYPKCNAVLAAIVLLYASKILKTITDILTAMMIHSNDGGKSVMNVVVLGSAILFAYLVALLLRVLGMVTLGTIATVAVVLGVVINQIVMDLTWNVYRRGLGVRAGVGDTPIVRASPSIIGTLMIFLLGLALHVAALTGANSQSRPLPSSCADFANDGTWLHINPCSLYSRGVMAREYETANFHESMSSCEEEQVQQWAWKISTKCNFHRRGDQELLKKTARRHLVFIGDTMVRETFYAVCRSLGNNDCGAFDGAALMHTDERFTVQETRLEYKWAPLAVDQADKLKQYHLESKSGVRPDLVVVGGGAWDRLHVYATDEDQESHKMTVKKLTSELLQLKKQLMPVIWVTPTTVNTKALSSKEKRNQMSEEGIEEMRRIYSQFGVEMAASFVLDGQAFTQEVVHESFDGIHYPHYVYDAGAQILANAMDWLIAERNEVLSSQDSPPTGSMGNAPLGLLVLLFISMNVIFFDCYAGLSYLVSAFLKLVLGKTRNSFPMPNELYDEAYQTFHRRFRLPAVGQVNDDLRLYGVAGVSVAEGDTVRLLDNHSRGNRRDEGIIA